MIFVVAGVLVVLAVAGLASAQADPPIPAGSIPGGEAMADAVLLVVAAVAALVARRAGNRAEEE